MKKKLLTLGTVLAAMTLTACGQANGSKAKTSLNLMESDVVASLDTSATASIPQWDTLVQTMAGLYKSDKNDNPVPAMAKSYKKSKDGTRYTFYLRKAKWSNGDQVTAQDFVTAWRKGVSPTAMSGYNYIFKGIKNAAAVSSGKKKASTLGVKALDAHTLQVDLEYPMPTFVQKMVMPAFYPMDTQLVAKYGKKYGMTSKAMAFNGAFKVTGWKNTDEKWHLVKNKFYYAASEVKLQTMNYQVVKDSNTAHQLFEQGSLDDATVTGTTAQGLQKSKNLYHLYRSGNDFLNVNMAKGKTLSNVDLRHALYLVMDRNQLAKKSPG